MTECNEKVCLVSFSDQTQMVILAPDGPEAVIMAKRIAAHQGVDKDIVAMRMLKSAGYGAVVMFRPLDDTSMAVQTDFSQTTSGIQVRP